MKKQDPLISVVIPVYNVEQYLSRCLESVMKQTYTNLEIILVNDGSTDNCGKICDKYKKQDKRIRVIHQENGGLSQARNAGIETATGQYITFIDSDDYISDDYISYLYSIITKYHVKIALCDYLLFSDTIPISNASEVLKEQCLATAEVLEKMLYTEVYFISAWGKLYERSLFANVRYPAGKVYEDLATTHKLYMQVENIACGYAKNYYYFVRTDSITKQRFSKAQFDLIDNSKILADDIVKAYPEYKKGAVARQMHAYLSTYCRIINTDETYKKEKEELLMFIKKNRKIVLKDKKAPKRDKIALILLCCGEKNFKKIWNWYRKKKYKLKES